MRTTFRSAEEDLWTTVLYGLPRGNATNSAIAVESVGTDDIFLGVKSVSL